MKRLTYHGPGHVLRVPSGREIRRGDTAEVTNTDAAAAAAAPNINVTVDDTPEASDGEGHPNHSEEE